MVPREQSILLVSDNEVLCAAIRQEIKLKWDGLRVAAVSSAEAAREIVEDASPTVILLEEPSLSIDMSPETLQPLSRLDALVAPLALHAPVVVIAEPEHQAELAALVAAGLADFVARSSNCILLALSYIGQRLRQTLHPQPDALVLDGPPYDAPVSMNGAGSEEDFGEVLRHELNNPLTGILGNAELLLAEVRRKDDGKIPQGAQQRLETIASLAVRLRETVRRLSLDWQARQNPVH